MKSFHTESEAVLLIELDLKKSAILFLNSFKKDQLKRIQHLLEDFAYEYNWLEYYNYLKEKNEDMDLMWKDRNLKKIFPKLKKIALSDEPVLLIGETGTGKEIISQFIHFLSKRKEKPFSPINCASFSSDELICSELFGHKKGAFTGAISNAQGKIKSAEGGTLFLDEIQSSSFKFQNALLRFIERKEIQPVGSEKIERVNARVVSACSSCPKKLMDKRKLLPELYYRLSHFQIKLTPLREKKDIENYIFYFLFKICGKMGIKEKEITEEAMNYLKKYVWPGNLRELKATISSAVIHSKDDYIKIEDLPQEVIKQNRKISQSSELLNRKTLPEKLIEFEREEILRALRENDWNITKASKILGISRQNLQQRMKKLKIGY
jgi:DNA-binding NtrC family response regulator